MIIQENGNNSLDITTIQRYIIHWPTGQAVLLDFFGETKESNAFWGGVLGL
jgi:hypothetical protein